MTIASIDIGSNTVLLLIAQTTDNKGEFKTILNRYMTPRLGKNVKSAGEISSESIEKFYSVLDDYRCIIGEYNCDVVLANATNAMRIAENANTIIEDVSDRYGIDIKVISGDEEATLSYLGASSALSDINEKMVVDIGGGSTEIIYGKDDEILFRKSFPIGAVSLNEKFITKELVSKEDIANMKKYLQDIFAELNTVIPSSIPAIAVAGTPTTLSAMHQELQVYDENKIEGSLLEKSTLKKMIKSLRKKTPAEILTEYGTIIQGREDVILAGTVILKTIASIMNLEKFVVSGKGIRYGAVIEYLNNHNQL